MDKIIAWLAGAYLVLALVFGVGYLSASFKTFPYQYLDPIVQDITAYVKGANRESIAELVQLDLQERKTALDGEGFERTDTSFTDPGYMLLARYSKADQLAVVELVSAASGEVVHTWKPNLEAIFKASPEFNTGVNTKMAYRSQHPLLMENGDLLISSGEGPLARIDMCGEPAWVLAGNFHHSIERDQEGNVLVPNVGPRKELMPGVPLRDDGFAVIDPDGAVLEEYYLSDILLNSTHQGLVLGVGPWEEDRFHLNDVQPLPGKSYKQGVLLSIRNLSAVAFFVPETNTLEWLKVGPWINQHDIQVLGEGRYGVFGNQLVRGAEQIYPEGFNSWFVFDKSLDEVQTPFDEILKKHNVGTTYEGRGLLLENGDLFVEDTLSGRLLRLSPTKLRWQYTNKVSGSTIGALHWSRYLDNTDVTDDLKRKMDDLTCKN